VITQTDEPWDLSSLPTLLLESVIPGAVSHYQVATDCGWIVV